MKCYSIFSLYLVTEGCNEGLFLLLSYVISYFEQVVLAILKIHLHPFNGRSLILLKKRKEINKYEKK